MLRPGIAFLLGLTAFAFLVVLIAESNQGPVLVFFEVVVIGLLTYAFTFLVRPRRVDDQAPPTITAEPSAPGARDVEAAPDQKMIERSRRS